MSDQPVFSGVDDAVEAMLSQPSEDSTEAVTDDTEVTEEEETQESVQEELESTEEEESDEDSSEAEEDEEDEADEEDPEEEYLFKVGEGDDEVVVKDAEEARQGYLRNKDYTKKTQEVAKERKEVQTEKASLLETKAEYVEALATMKAASSEQLKDFLGVDWVQLQKDDPIEFDERQKEFEAAKLAYEQSSQLQEQKNLELQKETLEYAQLVRKEEMEKLQAVVPELVDNTELLSKVTEFAEQAYGFSANELTNIYDHRQVRVLIDAYKNSTTSQKKEAGTKKLKQSKTIKPKASTPTTSKARKAKARKQVLGKAGGISVEDAVQALLN